MDATTVTLARVIMAPAARIFAAWTDPQLLQQWLAKSAEADARIGGHFRLQSGPDGNRHVVSGEYKEIVPGRRLVMTWIYEGSVAVTGVAESQLIVELQAYGAGVTELSLRHERISDAGYRELLFQGAWTQDLDKLEALCFGSIPERIGRVPDRIEREIAIEAPVQRVWAVVTQMQHLGGWNGEVDLRPGAVAAFPLEADTRIFVRFEQVEPPRYLAYRWARPAGEEPRPGNSTLVEYTLTPEGNSTRLHVVESGFASLEWPDEEIARYAKGNTEGWNSELSRWFQEQVRQPR